MVSWASHIKVKFGLTVEAWQALLIRQSGRCAVCEVPMVEPHVDHDHETDVVRGLLCNNCNVRLHAGADLRWFLQAIAYLDLDRTP